MQLITSHLNADFDAFASMVAALRLYPEAHLALPGAQQPRLREFTSTYGDFGLMRARELEAAAVAQLIVVDTKSPERLGALGPIAQRPDVIVHLYDHHPRREGDIDATFELIEKVGATATIMTELLIERQIRPDPLEATLLMLGIYEETGSMIFPTTTERDMRAAAHLLHFGASLKVVAQFLRAGLTVEELELLSELGRSASFVYASGMKVALAKASREAYVGDAAQFAGKLLEIEGADAAFIILRMEGKVLVVGRSRAPEISASEILSAMGGGGHPSAASATVDDQPLELIEETLAGLIKSHARPGKTAADVMTRPVITVTGSTLVREAQTMLTKYGVNVLPVVEEEKFIGLLMREIVEKAILHGFKKTAVREFADRDITLAAPSTPLHELQSAMIEKNQRFVPVLQGDTVIGAITRTDILRVIYEDHLRRTGLASEDTSGAHARPQKSTAALLKNRYPREVYSTLCLAGEVAESLHMTAYLVGGSVRDLMRTRENLDIDIVVEGDGIEFARAMSARLGGRIKTHERFGTAKIIAPALRLDVATARTEYYEAPAALPRVEMSSIKKDLYRRDFTINTMAIKLTGGEFGKLVDFFGGMRDLKDKTIRVLHNLSLVEDPTRAFRAVRFAERFGFKISRHTEDLIRSAIRLDIFSRLSGARLYDELMLAIKEPDPAKVIARLDHYGLLSVIHPAIKYDERLAGALGAAHDTLKWFELSFAAERANAKLVYLMGLIGGLDDEQREAALRRLSAPKKIHDRVIRDMREARAIVRRLPLGDAALIRATLGALPTEAVLHIMMLAENQGARMEVSHYMLKLRHEKTILGGDDLKAMGIEPGPVYSDLLSALLDERLRGHITTLQDEEAFIRSRIA